MRIIISGEERDGPTYVITRSKAYAVFTYFTKDKVSNGDCGNKVRLRGICSLG